MSRLLLVVGSSRSGTTLTARMLGNHSRIQNFDELHYVDEVLPRAQISTVLSEASARRAWGTLDERLHSGLFNTRRHRNVDANVFVQRPVTGAELLLEFLTANSPKGTLFVCEQTPQNLQHFRVFVAALPGSRVIAPIRDPRDVLLSQKGRWRRRKLGSDAHSRRELVRNWVNYQPVILSLMWRKDARVLRTAAAMGEVHCFRFEDLVAEPEPRVRAICDFLGISFEPQMLEVNMVGSSNAVDGPGLGFRPETVGKWKQGLSATETWVTEMLCGKEMGAWGYKISRSRPDVGGVIALGGMSMIRGLAIVPLNGRRLRSAMRRLST